MDDDLRGFAAAALGVFTIFFKFKKARRKEENRHTTYRAAGRVTSANTRWECSTTAGGMFIFHTHRK